MESQKSVASGDLSKVYGNTNYVAATENTVDEIQSLAGENVFTDRRDEDSEILSSYWVFRIAVGRLVH